jgi:hypothetical protein
MPKKEKKTEPASRPQSTKELHEPKSVHQPKKGARKDWPREESSFEQAQRAKMKDTQLKILKDEHYDKHKKAARKIGGVRGKFHPSLDRTRKRT